MVWGGRDLKAPPQFHPCHGQSPLKQSSLVLGTAGDGAPTAPLSNQCQGLSQSHSWSPLCSSHERNTLTFLTSEMLLSQGVVEGKNLGTA